MRSMRSSMEIRHESLPTCTSLINLCLLEILLLCWDTCLSALCIHVWQYSREHFLLRPYFLLAMLFFGEKILATSAATIEC